MLLRQTGPTCKAEHSFPSSQAGVETAGRGGGGGGSRLYVGRAIILLILSE